MMIGGRRYHINSRRSKKQKQNQESRLGGAMNPSLIRLPISLSYSLSKFNDSLTNSFFQALDFLMASSYSFSDYYYDGDDEDNDSLFFDQTTTTTTISDSPEDLSNERLYLVHFRWWKEARDPLFSEISGVSYTISAWEDFSDVDFYSEVVFDLLRVEKSDDDDHHVKELGFPDREYAVIEEWMFLTALKWHNDFRNTGSSLPREDNIEDLFSLKIRLSFLRGTNSLILKIRRKDNDVGTFKKACDFIYVESGMLQILDFSEQTTQVFTNDRKLNSDKYQPNEILMELQVYGLISHVKQMLEREVEMRAVISKTKDSHCSGSLELKGDTINEDSLIQVAPPIASSFSETCELGLSGLHNLGNTCYMNSAIQCLVHTPRLIDYFLGNFRKDLNFNNPLGMNGKLALAFGDLLRKLWAPGANPVTPTMFKSTLFKFAPQFSGYSQHDSQELLSFLLDGLHEDLNRVKFKPYIEVKDSEGYPDEEVADECWQNHLARNDSIVVAIFQGQYRSTLVCPLCKKLSITFDPFMYMSLPLPSTTTMRTMTLTVLSTDGTTLPTPVNISVPKNGRLKDVVEAVSTSCSLGEDETLLLAEIYCHRVSRFLNKPYSSDSESIELINDCDQLVAYRLLKVSDESPLVVFMHQHEELQFEEISIKERFGFPLVARMSDLSTGSEIRQKFLELLTPFLMPDVMSVDVSDDRKNAVRQDTGIIDAINTGGNSLLENDFEFYLEGKNRKVMPKILGNEPIPSSSGSRPINVVVSWPVKMLQLYDTSRLSSLREICDTLRTWPQEPVSISKCLEAFLKEEPLGPDDMWYCYKCNKHQNASKKLDLWRLPEILVIHLKRFSSNQEKLETFVDFPVDDFDLSSYTVPKGGQVSRRYKLYAVINHDGAMGRGHYTAFAQHMGDRWFEFNDSHIEAVDVDAIKTNAAYVLFYKRISDV